MKVALIHDALFPVDGYGGTERVVWWLAKGLSTLGVKVLLVCRKGSSCPFAETTLIENFNENQVDLVHLFNTPLRTPTKPYLVTIGGNGKAGEKFPVNTVFVSLNHAKRHGAKAFVHNGLDPEEYIFQEKKTESLVFLAKASWNVKNVKGAIRIANKSRRPLHILGGKKFFFNHWRNIHWEGMVNGAVKARFLASAQGLLFPVIWNEPFGIAVIEAMVCGTPVLATPFGSLPELVTEEVGSLCRSEEDFLGGIERLKKIHPADCRNWVIKNFTYQKMAEKYLNFYERVLSGESLNSREPETKLGPSQLFEIPVRID